MEGWGRKVAEEGGEWKKNGAREEGGKGIVEGREREWEGGRERESGREGGDVYSAPRLMVILLCTS